ncbi:MAG: histidine phosphatase family protein [Candidatus Binataceae bacterium]|nr:histidine phosphatase family protein [Candidatus Binataceae bacterium]
MAVTLVLVRHGETEGNSSIRYYGATDIALSEIGRLQMRSVRRELERRTIGAFATVFASPLSRAIESARVITSGNPSITPIEEFREINFGLFEGLTAEEIRERYPQAYRHWMADRFAPDFTFPEGDNRRAFTERVHRGLDRMLAMIDDAPPSDGYVLLVAHRGVIRTIVERLTNESPAVELASIQILLRASDWQPQALDLTDHLRP